MRIIGGALGGRKINAPISKWPTRPTTDMAKEALFNILQNRIDFSTVSICDLFSGTGNLSYEAFSRGCNSITAVEKFRPAIRFIKTSLALFEAEESIEVISQDVFSYLKSTESKFDLILADPPYALRNMNLIPELIFKNQLLKNDGLLVIEHDQTTDFSRFSNFIENRKYGQSSFSFFQ